MQGDAAQQSQSARTEVEETAADGYTLFTGEEAGSEEGEEAGLARGPPARAPARPPAHPSVHPHICPPARHVRRYDSHVRRFCPPFLEILITIFRNSDSQVEKFDTK